MPGRAAAAKGAWDEAVASYEINLAHWQDLPKADRAAINKPMPPAPLEHFLTTDSTKEALAVMAATSAGAAAYRDEIGAWVAAFDAYRSGRGGDRLYTCVMGPFFPNSSTPIGRVRSPFFRRKRENTRAGLSA